MRIVIKDKRHLPAAAKQLIKIAGKARILAFCGEMGSGKTTIIKAVCKCLGAGDIVSSPTFTIVNEYRTSLYGPLFHIDLYRIRKQEEVFDFGIEEYLAGESYCFVEWPEMIWDLLPQGTLRIRITVGEDEQRILEIT
jgi:tRNA threonylcarbamoyladenosine biosynthesis protein TsaE